MKIEITADELAAIKRILRDNIPDAAVWAFGSRVRGTAAKTSDLDLVVVSETPLDPLTMAGLRDAFSDSTLPYKVDLVEWVRAAEPFRKIILESRAVVQSPGIKP